MKNKTLAITGALLIGGLLTFNSIAFADNVDTTASASVKTSIPFEKAMRFRIDGDHRGQKDMVFIHKQDWSADLKTLVSEGTITQTVADKIQAYLTEQDNAIKAEMEKLQAMTLDERKAYFESKRADLKTAENATKDVIIKKHDLFGDMVEKGVITQQQSDAIKSKLQALEQAKRQEAVKASLDKLVESKTITEAQATKIAEYINKLQAEKMAEMEKIQAMTKEEVAAYFKDKDKDVLKVNIFAQLVTDKVLTQEQADAVQKALHPMGHGKGVGPMMIKKVFTKKL